jgi:DUF4097 and DUF4098 domain-containing protein YvlB
MKKIGTLTSAAALIFIGIWMIINKSNPELGMTIFKFWPIIFVLLGVEILMAVSMKKENMRIQVNYWIIPVVVVFIIINAYTFTKNKVTNIIKDTNIQEMMENGDISFNESFDSTKYNIVDSTKVLEQHGDKLKIEVTNGDIHFKESEDGNIKIEAQVYVKKNENIDSYDIKEIKENDGYKIPFKERYIKKVKTDIYLPKGYNITIDATNINVQSKDENLKANYFIDGTNGNVELFGDIEEVEVDVINGNVDIKNKKCKNIDIDVTNGKVDIDTEDNNIDIDVDTSIGALCSFNGDKFKKLDKKIGNGEGKINVNVTNGLVNIETQE